jgi:hypothetical protein
VNAASMAALLVEIYEPTLALLAGEYCWTSFVTFSNRCQHDKKCSNWCWK